VNARLARAGDVPAVADVLDDATLFLRSLGGVQWRLPFPRAELRERVAREELYVVEVDGELAATFTLLWEDRFFWGDRPPDAGYLHKLAVLRRFAGRGVGTAAVAWVDAEVAARGREFVRLDCQRDLPGIRRYYERLGFELRGEKEGGGFAWALYERRVRT
jgi:GNAT superfamily N-acetyltransferase